MHIQRAYKYKFNYLVSTYWFNQLRKIEIKGKERHIFQLRMGVYSVGTQILWGFATKKRYMVRWDPIIGSMGQGGGGGCGVYQNLGFDSNVVNDIYVSLYVRVCSFLTLKRKEKGKYLTLTYRYYFVCITPRLIKKK